MAKTTTKKTEPKRFVCRECSKRTHLGETLDSGFFCQACYEAIGLRNDHSDRGHEVPVEGCPACAEEPDEPATPAAPKNRETWLLEAIELLRPIFQERAGAELPERVSVSVGFPGGGSARKHIGECWAAEAVSDGAPAIFISPILDSAPRALETLVHELVHAMGLHGHRADFGKVARAMGLEGKLTATVAGEELVGILNELAEELGPYGHGAITLQAANEKKQSTRMLKVECEETGYKVRLTRKWLDEYGAPLCPCHEERMLEG